MSVVIVDDHPAIREVTRHSVEQAMDMVVAAETDAAEEAVRLVKIHDPDVAVVDLFLSEGPSFELLDTVRAQRPDTKLLVYSTHNETVYAERALRGGASGYLMKKRPMAELLTAVRRVAEGEMYLSPEMTARVLRRMQEEQAGGKHFPVDELTDRDLQVFQMLGQVFQMLGRGLSIETIVDRLGHTRKTTETYRRRAKEKLGYDTIDEVVFHAAHWILGTNGEKDRSQANPS